MNTNYIILFAAIAGTLMSVSCSQEKAEPAHPEWSYDAVIYEMNVRQ